jgi:hypothetical protein
LIKTFCWLEIKLPGPFHKKAEPGTELALKKRISFEHTVDPEAERVGVGCTTTVVEEEAVQLLAAVTVTL